jgi:hypothetical protein
MKKTNKVKMGPLGTPLGNPLSFFNSQKAKRSLPRAQNGKIVGTQNDNPPPTSFTNGKIIGPQNKGETNNGYWFNNTEKRAMDDAKSRYYASRTRDNNNDPNAEKEYEDLIKNYQPEGPIIPLKDQVAELNQKYPYYDGFQEVPFKGGSNNKGWLNEYKNADKMSYAKEDAMSNKYPNVGTGMIHKKGGSVKIKKK